MLRQITSNSLGFLYRTNNKINVLNIVDMSNLISKIYLDEIKIKLNIKKNFNIQTYIYSEINNSHSSSYYDFKYSNGSILHEYLKDHLVSDIKMSIDIEVQDSFNKSIFIIKNKIKDG